MSIKSIIIVIIISIATGIGIYYLSTPKTNTLSNAAPKEIPATTETIAEPSPLPSEPPIDKTTDLSAEIKNQVSPDFTEDYKKLKEEVNTKL
jgi:hypothetical protein